LRQHGGILFFLPTCGGRLNWRSLYAKIIECDAPGRIESISQNWRDRYVANSLYNALLCCSGTGTKQLCISDGSYGGMQIVRRGDHTRTDADINRVLGTTSPVVYRLKLMTFIIQSPYMVVDQPCSSFDSVVDEDDNGFTISSCRLLYDDSAKISMLWNERLPSPIAVLFS